MIYIDIGYVNSSDQTEIRGDEVTPWGGEVRSRGGGVGIVQNTAARYRRGNILDHRCFAWNKLILIVFGVLSRRHFLVYLTPGPLIFLMGVLYAGCRGSIEDSELGGKLFIGLLFYTVAIFYCFNIILNDCTSNFVKILVSSIRCRNQRIQFAHRQRVCAWKPQIVRNCGASELYGVQFGLAEIVLLCECLKNTGFIRLLVSVMMFLCGLLMLTLTGSRTGLLVFVVGSYFMLLAKAGFTARFAITALVGVIMLAIGTVFLIRAFETGADNSILDFLSSRQRRNRRH